MSVSVASTAARDELRLGAMLFALHLNAGAAAHAATPSGATGLACYQLGEVEVRFLESKVADVLLVLFVPVALGNAAGCFLAGKLLQSFELLIEKQQQQQQQQHIIADGPAAATPRGGRATTRRSEFASHVQAAVAALAGWILDQLLEDMARLTVPAPANGAPTRGGPAGASSLAAVETSPTLSVAVTGVAALHSAAICAAMQTLPAAAASSRSHGNLSAGQGAATPHMKPKANARRRGQVRSAPDAPPLLSLLEAQPAPSVEAGMRSGRRRGGGGGGGGGGGVDVGCFGCLRSPRMLPPPLPAGSGDRDRLPMLPSPPMLIWRGGGASSAGTEEALGAPWVAPTRAPTPQPPLTAASHPSTRLLPGLPGLPPAEGAYARELHAVVGELQRAWGHRCLGESHAAYSAAHSAAYGATPHPSATAGAAATAATATSMTVVLLRSPLVLRVCATVRASDPSEAVGPGRGATAAAAEHSPAVVVAAIAYAVQPWLSPLIRSVGFLGSADAKARKPAAA